MQKVKTMRSLLITSLLGFSLHLSAAEVPEGTQLASKQILNVFIADNPVSLDPTFVTDVISSQIVNQLFATLVRTEPNGEIIPELAEAWTHNADATEWTFKIRDAQWSNGKPITAHDIEYSWKRLIDPKTAAGYANYLSELGVKNISAIVHGEKSLSAAGFYAVDRKTFKVILDNPLPFFANTLSLTALSIVPKETIEKYGVAWTNPKYIVTNGAYILKDYIVNSYTRLDKNPKYWDEKKVVIKQAYIYVVKGESEAYKRFLAKDLDAIQLNPTFFQQAQKLTNAKFFDANSTRTVWLDINQTQEPLNDIRIREALNIAVNRKEIVEKVFRSNDIATALILPNSINEAQAISQPEWFNQDIKTRIKHAQELIKEAGYSAKKPLKLNFDYNTAEVYKKLFIALQAQYKQAFGKSVEITLHNMEWKTLLSNRALKKYHVARAGWGADYDNAFNFFSIFKSNNPLNRIGFKSTEYDNLIKEVSITIKPERRAKLFQKLSDTLGQNFALIPLYARVDTFLLRKNLEGWSKDNSHRYFQDIYFTK